MASSLSVLPTLEGTGVWFRITSDVKDLNDIDRAIVGVLQVEGRSTFAQIAQHVGLSPAAVHERVKKLEARGVITATAPWSTRRRSERE